MRVLSNIFKSRDKPQNATSGSAYRFFLGGVWKHFWKDGNGAFCHADDSGVVLVYKCGQEKLNNLYYQVKEQRRCSTWRRTKNLTFRNMQRLCRCPNFVLCVVQAK